MTFAVTDTSNHDVAVINGIAGRNLSQVSPIQGSVAGENTAKAHSQQQQIHEYDDPDAALQHSYFYLLPPMKQEKNQTPVIKKPGNFIIPGLTHPLACTYMHTYAPICLASVVHCR